MPDVRYLYAGANFTVLVSLVLLACGGEGNVNDSSMGGASSGGAEGSEASGELAPCSEQGGLESGCWELAWQQLATLPEDPLYSAVTVSLLDRLHLAGFSVLEGAASEESSEGILTIIDPSGRPELSEGYGPDRREAPQAIATDADGNTLIWGNSFVGASRPSLSKLDPEGRELWSLRLTQGLINVAAAGLVVDSSGNVYVAGHTSGEWEDPDIEGFNGSGYVLKVDPAGSIVWFHELSSPGTDSINGLALDEQEQLVIASELAGDGASKAYGESAACIRKLDHDGKELWTTLIESELPEAAVDVGVDALGRIVVAGTTYGELATPPDAAAGEDMDAGEAMDAFVAQLDADGTVLWVRQFGGPKDESIDDLEVTPGGRIYALGSAYEYFVDPDSDENDSAPRVKSDGFLVELDSEGEEIREIALRLADDSIVDSPRDMVFDSQGGLYIVGRNLDDDGPLGASWDDARGFILKLVPSP